MKLIKFGTVTESEDGTIKLEDFEFDCEGKKPTADEIAVLVSNRICKNLSIEVPIALIVPRH
jgi:hypothetical protein